MKPRKRRWLHYKQTHILLELKEDNLLPEWQVVGYVLKRQIYENLAAQWQAWWCSGTVDLVAAHSRIRDAKWALEQALDAQRGYVQPITEPKPVRV